MQPSIPILLLCLAFATTLHSTPVISEFLAVNGTTLADEDGDFPDWIELHNPDPTSADLSGYFLTDDPAIPNKWQIPATTTLAASGHMIVFASDKNRAVAGAELHTNFRLSSREAEYIALVAPDGSTVLDSYTYPAQDEDVSFGYSEQITATPLTDTSAPSILIPQSAGELPANWNDPSFTPTASWTSGTAPSAVGFDTSSAPIPLVNIALTGTATQSTSHSAGPAGNGNDGNTGNFSHTLANDNAAWWQVTFSADQEIHEIVLHNRDSCCQVRFRDLTIEIRDGGGSVLYTSPLLNPENSLNNPASIAFDIAADNGSAVTGRSVRILRTPDPDYSGQGAAQNESDANVLAIGEILVMVPDPNAGGGGGSSGEENLALDGTASQTTTLSSFTAALAIDGNLGNFTHTVNTDTSPEWRLQLASRAIISEITLHNRTSCCAERLRDITVEVVDEDGTTTFLSDLLNPGNVDGSPGLINLDLVGLTGSAVIGKTIKVRRTPDPSSSGDDAVVISLGEVEVIGEAVYGFSTVIRDDIKTAALGNNASGFLRIPFNVTDPSAFSSLALRMRYDDGFIAYLNGTQIASSNAPASPAWNSVATTERDSAAGFTFVDFDVAAHIGLLSAGNNVLAIHMLNITASDSDLFMQPQLLATSTNANANAYLVTPTPGDPNDSAWYFDKVADTDFDIDRGFYDAPFFINITTPTPGASIRYTTDGNAPSETSGTLYTGPIQITGTTVVRAIGYKDTFRSTNIDTHTYIFRDDVITSPVMRTSITQDPTYGPQMRDSLVDLPTVSLAFTGDIDRAEKASSVELIGFADGDAQVDAGMSRFGSYVTNFEKRNIRLAFRSEYGPKKLDYPLYNGHERDLRPAVKFDQLDLRTGSHDMVARGFYMSNRFLDDTLIDMGHVNPHGRFIHLYINGTYWGMYHLRERWNADMNASYLGGAKENYEAVASNRGGGSFSNATPYDGDGSAWATVVSHGSDYASIKDHLNVPQFIDFMLLLMSGNSEAEHRAVGPVGAGSGYLLYHNDGDGFTRTPPNRTGHPGPNNLLSTLRAENHPDFRVLLADRIQKHYFNGGAMTPGPAITRLTDQTTAIERAFFSEAARWNYRTPASWTSAKDSYISNILSSLDQTMITQFQNAGLLPATAAPSYSQHGGEVAANYQLAMTVSTAGTIYYTTDNTDPRLPGGAISPAASTYSSALTLTDNTVVRSRTRNGSEWSGLNEAFFTIIGIDPITASDIAISEIHYNPSGLEESTEFIELLNISNRPINLRNTRFSDGVLYDFPTMRDTILAPGERIVIVASIYHMNLVYGLGIPVTGVYSGNLNNDGEPIRFEENDGTLIAQFTYNDSATWPSAADGSGASLTMIAPTTDPDGSDPLSWRSSSVLGGTPGTGDASGTTFPGGSIDDLLNYGHGNDGTRQESFATISLLENSATNHAALTFRANLQADDLIMHLEHSENMVDWFEGSGQTELVERQDHPDGTSQLTFRSLDPQSPTTPRKFLRVRFELR